MSKLTLDAPTIEKLRSVTETVEVCDEAGASLGLFSPKTRELNEKFAAWVRARHTVEELDRREAEGGPRGRRLEEVVRELAAE